MSGQAYVNGADCSCPPGLGHTHTWYASDPEAIHPQELGWRAWQAMCVESRGTKADRRDSLALRARRAGWPEAPAPPAQLGLFG